MLSTLTSTVVRPQCGGARRGKVAAGKTPNATVLTDPQKAGITGRRHTVAELARTGPGRRRREGYQRLLTATLGVGGCGWRWEWVLGGADADRHL